MIESLLSKYSWSRLDSVFLICLLVISILVFGVFINVGGFWWTDEPRHAMDGVYFLDLFRDRPFSNLYGYTVEYFVHYPALGFTWYLPFFAFIESLFFAVFGISEASARLSVLFFCFLALSAWYIWARPIWGGLPTFFGGLFFLFNPYVVLWGRAVMLEIPALAMVFLALLCFHFYLRNPSHLLSIATGIVIGLMLLTKQITLFIFPVMLVYALISNSWQQLVQPKSLWAIALILISLAIVFLHATKFSTVSGSFGANKNDMFAASRAILTLKAIWEAYPFPFKVLTLAGFLSIFKTKLKSSDYLIFSWIAAWFILFTLFSDKINNTIRYTIYLTPALGFLSVRWLDLLSNPKLRHWSVSLLALFYLGYGSAAIIEKPYYVNGYEQAAEYTSNNTNNAPILFCCKHDGNFIFNIRKGDPHHKKIILRADKTLVSMAVHTEFGVKSYVNNDQDIFDILDKYGVQTIVSENKDLVGVPELNRLINLLQTDSFEKIKAISIVSNVPEFKNLQVNIFRYKKSKAIHNRIITIPMPHIGRDLHLLVD